MHTIEWHYANGRYLVIHGLSTDTNLRVCTHTINSTHLPYCETSTWLVIFLPRTAQAPLTQHDQIKRRHARKIQFVSRLGLGTRLIILYISNFTPSPVSFSAHWKGSPVVEVPLLSIEEWQGLTNHLTNSYPYLRYSYSSNEFAAPKKKSYA